MKNTKTKLKKGMSEVVPPIPPNDPYLTIAPKRTPNRLLIGVPTIGNVRMEWVRARYGQTIPCNFSMMEIQQTLNSYMPLGYQIVDAENLIAKAVVQGGYEWLLSWEDDNVPPLNALVKINEYMLRGDIPIVSGLYFTKSVPPEPLLYRGGGTSYYADWKMGDKVWVSGIPFGFTLIHGSIIKALWDNSPEYAVGGTNEITRRVFNIPSEAFIDPVTGVVSTLTGTSDLAWCRRMKDDKIYEKAGWPENQKKEFPLLVDTTIFLGHIDRNDGTNYPRQLPTDFINGKITFKEAIALLST